MHFNIKPIIKTMFNNSLKIYPELNKHLAQDSLLTEYVFFATLKKAHSSHFKYKKSEGINNMSKIMGCNSSTTRRVIKKLFALEWIYEDRNKKDIRFVSDKIILAQFGLKKQSKGFNIPYIGKDTKYLLQQTVFQSNLEHQQFKFKEKLADMGKSIVESYKRNPELTMDTIKRERHTCNFKLNNDFTISRAKIAKLINKKSATTGMNAIKRLRKLGMVYKDVNRLIRLEGLDGKSYKGNFDNSVYTSQNGEVFMQLTNKVEFNTVQSIWDIVNQVQRITEKEDNLFYNNSFIDNLILAIGYSNGEDELSNKLINNSFNLDYTIKDLLFINNGSILYNIYYNKSISNIN